MNTLKFYPKTLKKAYEQNIINAGIEKSPEKYHNLIFIIAVFFGMLSSTIFFIFEINMIYALLIFVLVNIFFYFKISLAASNRIKRMEEVFPDVVSLMASNLRSGITIDHAFLLAARPEFAPLDKEILNAGKEVATGTDILTAFKSMSKRIDSEKISKVVLLIISGLKAGGNISNLLEETARNMKEKEVIEKKAASTILMYVVFIFFAVGVGAPVLFGLSSVLVEVVITLASRMPDLASLNMDLPFTFNQISISLNFIIYFSLSFIIVSDFISCFVIGLVNKGEGKTGLKLFIPLLILSVSIFFVIRIFLSKILLNAISGF